jgi:hypothetical protein
MAKAIALLVSSTMMFERNPIWLMGIGTVLLLFGFSFVFMMVIRLIEPSFFFSFIAYGASFVGFLMGIIGLMKFSNFKQ